MPTDRCPTHPRFPVDDCPFCEAKIARQELNESDPPDDGGTIAEARYERWLGEVGE
jgi:hypothetical protein